MEMTKKERIRLGAVLVAGLAIGIVIGVLIGGSSLVGMGF